MFIDKSLQVCVPLTCVCLCKHHCINRAHCLSTSDCLPSPYHLPDTACLQLPVRAPQGSLCPVRVPLRLTFISRHPTGSVTQRKHTPATHCETERLPSGLAAEEQFVPCLQQRCSFCCRRITILAHIGLPKKDPSHHLCFQFSLQLILAHTALALKPVLHLWQFQRKLD